MGVTAHQTNIKYLKHFNMYFCYDILSKPMDASFDMESPLADEEMDADGDLRM